MSHEKMSRFLIVERVNVNLAASSDLESNVAPHRRWCHHARFRIVRICFRSIGAHNR